MARALWICARFLPILARTPASCARIFLAYALSAPFRAGSLGLRAVSSYFGADYCLLRAGLLGLRDHGSFSRGLFGFARGFFLFWRGFLPFARGSSWFTRTRLLFSRALWICARFLPISARTFLSNTPTFFLSCPFSRSQTKNQPKGWFTHSLSKHPLYPFRRLRS